MLKIGNEKPGRVRTGAGDKIGCGDCSARLLNLPASCINFTVIAFGEAAARLTSLGLPVFRLRACDKRPMRPGWQQEASTDPGMVRKLWRETPCANVGLACGPACWVLDVDGDEGQDALVELEVRHDRLPATPTSLTGSGGLHLLFAPSPRIRNSARRLGAGLDTRGAGGYVVAPPSVHPSGSRYAWVEGREPWSIPLAPAPGWLLDLLDPPTAPRPAPRSVQIGAVGTAYVAAAVRQELESVALSCEGTRNGTLFIATLKLGRFVREGQLDARSIGPALVGAALGAGLDRPEAERTVASGLRAAIGRAA